MTHILKQFWLEMSDEYWYDEKVEFMQMSIRVKQRFDPVEWDKTVQKNKEYAYAQLKEATGQDFGFDLEAWKNWLRKNTNAWNYG